MRLGVGVDSGDGGCHIAVDTLYTQATHITTPTLDWIGKEAVVHHHQQVPFHLLKEDPQRQVGDPAAENMLIQGDNLLALKALLPHYAGQVKCVYIDPPYNTGNEGWAYNDNVNSPEIRRWLGETVGKEAEDLSRHDKWLCMMYPRIALLHELLAENGSFWMTIDDNELHQARSILDEIFGTTNFIANVVWHKRVSPANDATYFSKDHDYIVVYAKSKRDLTLSRLPKTAEQAEYYTNPDGDSRGLWNSQAYTCAKSASERPNLYYPLSNPNTGQEVWPRKDRVWAYEQSTHEEHVEQDLLYWGLDGTSNKPRLKNFLKDSDPVVPRSVWYSNKTGSNQEAKLEIREIMGADVFKTPKPVNLIEEILTISTEPGDLVLDSFAGSGTTGHAVLQKNQKDGFDRRFILVEMEEEVAQEVAHQRLQRAVEGYEYEGTEKETLMEEKIGVRELKKGNEIYARSEEIKSEREDDFDQISRSMDDGVFTLTGKTKITERKDGLGSGFRYLTLGPAIRTTETAVSDDLTFEDLGRHVFYTETGTPLPRDAAMNAPLVGAMDGLAVYLLFGAPTGDGEVGAVGSLTRDTLASLPDPGADISQRVIYGDMCRIDEHELNQCGITFRQIPYDIRTA